MKLNRTGSNWTELERNKINENWRIIEGLGGTLSKLVTGLVWKEPVDSFADLPSAASEGDTRMARDSGKVYRFNGEVWQEIQQIDAGPVNEVDRRLTEQLAQKATKEELQDVESRKMDKNTTDIGIYQINKNKGLIDETYLSEELLQQMAGNTPIHSVPADRSITEVKIAKKAITPEVTTFAQSVNKFNGVYAPSNIYLGGDHVGDTGLILEGESNYYTAFVEVSPLKTYTVSSKNNNRFKIGVSSEKPELGGTARIVFYDDSASQATFTLQGDERFIIIYAGNNQKPDYIQVEEGSEATEHTDGVKVNLAPKSVEVSSIKGVTASALLAGLPLHFNVNLDEGKIETNSNGYVLVGTESYRLNDGEYSYADLTFNSVIVAYNPSNSNIIFLRQSDLANKNNRNLPILGIIRKDRGFCQINGNHTINGNTVIPYTGESQQETVKGDLFIHEDEFKIDDEPTTIPDKSDIDVDFIYGIFDNLMSEFPNYITKQKFGDSSDNTDIYRYDFIPPKLTTDSSDIKEVPKIFVQAGIHGHEWGAVLTVANFFSNLCRNWTSNKGFKKMKYNVHFIVVPVLNVWGLNAGAGGAGGTIARKNKNGVDLNRNFPTGWSNNITDPNHVYYPGTEPLSEPESQALYSFMKTNDVLYAIDVHNYGNYPSSNDYALWLGSNDENIRLFLRGVGTHSVSDLASKYESLQNENHTLLKVATSAQGGAVNEFNELGVINTLLELPYEIDTNDGDKKKIANKFSQEALGNLILGILRKYPFLPTL